MRRINSYIKQLIINLKSEVEDACLELMDIYSMTVEVYSFANKKKTIKLCGEFYGEQKLDATLIKCLNRLSRKLIVEGWDLNTDVMVRMETFTDPDRPTLVLSHSIKSLNEFLKDANEVPRRSFFRRREIDLIGLSIKTLEINFIIK